MYRTIVVICFLMTACGGGGDACFITPDRSFAQREMNAMEARCELSPQPRQPRFPGD